MKKIFLLALTTLALASCDSNEENQLRSSEAVTITASIGEGTVSRASDDTWASNDEIGISSAVGGVTGPYINLKYTTADGSGSFSGNTPIYFYKPMTLTAYYPYTGSEKTAPGLIEAVTNAGNQSSGNQPKIDFLWDSKTNQDKKDFSAANPYVNFTFAHKMSKLTFTFVGTEEFKDEENRIYIPEVKVSDMVSYEIEGLVLDGTFDTATGVCAVKDGVEAENLKISFTKGTVNDDVPLAPLIVFPQKPGNSTVKLHVYTDEFNNESVLQHYICPLTFGEGELKPGNSYKYTVKITKVGLVLQEMKIDNWNLERDVNLTATIDGGWKPDENQQ